MLRDDQTSHALQSLDYLLIVLEPRTGMAMFLFGGSAIRLCGLVVIVASFIVVLYHFCFSLLMDAIRDLKGSEEPAESADAK